MRTRGKVSRTHTSLVAEGTVGVGGWRLPSELHFLPSFLPPFVGLVQTHGSASDVVCTDLHFPCTLFI